MFLTLASLLWLSRLFVAVVVDKRELRENDFALPSLS